MKETVEATLGITASIIIILLTLFGITYPFSYIEENDYKEIRNIYSEGKPETNEYIDAAMKDGKLMVADLYLIRSKSNEEKDTIKYKKIVYEKRAN